MRFTPTPPPRRLERLDGVLRVAAVVLLPVDGNPGHLPAIDRLAEGLDAKGLEVRRGEAGGGPRPEETPVALRLDPAAADGPEEYVLEATSDGVRITAAAEPGLYYGAETFLQWLARHLPPTGAV